MIKTLELEDRQRPASFMFTFIPLIVTPYEHNRSSWVAQNNKIHNRCARPTIITESETSLSWLLHLRFMLAGANEILVDEPSHPKQQ